MNRGGNKKEVLILLLTVCIAVILTGVFPGKRADVVNASGSFLKEMFLILPALMVILGLFSVWVSKDIVMKYLGRVSGIRGSLIAVLFGSLPTGPLYLAFPVASALLKKGASVSNVVIFLSAWAAIKIPQEIVELQFLGFRFMVLRLSLTLIFVLIMGRMVEALAEKSV